MNPFDPVLYQILLWTCAALVGVVVFFLVRVANTFIQMGKDVTDIKIELKGQKTTQDQQTEEIRTIKKILKIA